LGAKVAIKGKEKPILMHKTEGPFPFAIGEEIPRIYLEHWPADYEKWRKKTFIFEYTRDAV